MAIIRACTGSLVRGVTADAARRYLLLDVQRSRATAGRIVTSRPFVREREWERKSLQSWPRCRCSPRRRKSREKSQVRTVDSRPTDNIGFINIRTVLAESPHDRRFMRSAKREHRSKKYIDHSITVFVNDDRICWSWPQVFGSQNIRNVPSFNTCAWTRA